MVKKEKKWGRSKREEAKKEGKNRTRVGRKSRPYNNFSSRRLRRLRTEVHRPTHDEL